MSPRGTSTCTAMGTLAQVANCRSPHTHTHTLDFFTWGHWWPLPPALCPGRHVPPAGRMLTRAKSPLSKPTRAAALPQPVNANPLHQSISPVSLHSPPPPLSRRDFISYTLNPTEKGAKAHFKHLKWRRKWGGRRGGMNIEHSSRKN